MNFSYPDDFLTIILEHAIEYDSTDWQIQSHTYNDEILNVRNDLASYLTECRNYTPMASDATSTLYPELGSLNNLACSARIA